MIPFCNDGNELEISQNLKSCQSDEKEDGEMRRRSEGNGREAHLDSLDQARDRVCAIELVYSDIEPCRAKKKGLNL